MECNDTEGKEACSVDYFYLASLYTCYLGYAVFSWSFQQEGSLFSMAGFFQGEQIDISGPVSLQQ